MTQSQWVAMGFLFVVLSVIHTESHYGIVQDSTIPDPGVLVCICSSLVTVCLYEQAALLTQMLQQSISPHYESQFLHL
jgi:hypothetical protein